MSFYLRTPARPPPTPLCWVRGDFHAKQRIPRSKYPARIPIVSEGTTKQIQCEASVEEVAKEDEKDTRRGGNLKAPPKALQRVTYCPTDSKDGQEDFDAEEEDERQRVEAPHGLSDTVSDRIPSTYLTVSLARILVSYP